VTGPTLIHFTLIFFPFTLAFPYLVDPVLLVLAFADNAIEGLMYFSGELQFVKDVMHVLSSEPAEFIVTDWPCRSM
jgi:hypothetical protein